MATTMSTTNNNSNSNNNHKHKQEPISVSAASSTTVIFDPMNINHNTTFVQADPSTFRAVVQKLTGVTENPLFEKLPVTTYLPSPRSSSSSSAAAAAAGGGGQSNGNSRNTRFKLHERRQYHNSSMRNLEIGRSFVHHHHHHHHHQQQQQGLISSSSSSCSPTSLASNSLINYHQHQFIRSPSSAPCCFNGDHQKNNNMVLISPVSTLDQFFISNVSSPSPRTPRSPQEEEDKAISEKGFYFHPSPRSKTSNSNDHHPPQLLPLFPLTSPRDSSSSSTSAS